MANVTWKIGGQAGDGIESTGEMFAYAASRYGLHLFTHRNFSSRIRGGYTSYEARLHHGRVLARYDTFDLLIALDQETIDRDIDDVRDKGVLIYDSTTYKPQMDEKHWKRLRTYGIPITDMAISIGSELYRNTVAVGVSCFLLGLPVENVMEIIERMFGRKGSGVVESNRKALEAGRAWAAQNIGAQKDLAVEGVPGRRMYLITGNEAIAMGAIRAGCRFFAGYPITPATSIMEYLIRHFPEYGGVAIQVEDEIAAIHAAIGAGYMGARAMTSSSGPGISLMTEALGLASMTEIPVVVVDVQRAGPSTGMPTKHEQADLNHVVFGGTGDIPRAVLAPGTVEECFEEAQRAFNIADRFQCPVFLLADEELCMNKQSVEKLNVDGIPIDRGEIAYSAGAGYKRYLQTPTGVSPRVVPGTPGGAHVESGVEHAEEGRIIENPHLRRAMMEKRMRKLKHISDYLPAPVLHGDPKAEAVLVGFGSTTGPALEALGRFRGGNGRSRAPKGKKVAYLQLRALWPFQGEQVRKLLAPARRIVVAESNAGGQLARLVRSEMDGHDRIHSLLKYDGRPFRPSEIVEGVRTHL
ncbi:MAG: 2-oxoacid:acceptor oxidoreductase subunit alpha [Halobacteria archaeon]